MRSNVIIVTILPRVQCMGALAEREVEGEVDRFILPELLKIAL